MTETIEKEMALLRSVFPDAEFHEADSGWIRIPRYTVQFGEWVQKELAVCFQVPAGYPGNAPYAFWVSPPMRLADGNGPPVNNYQEPSPTPFPGEWGKFSWSHADSWRPESEPASGSNFLNFALSFRDRFREGP
jgi:Prokaryotic E2 family E